MHVGTFVFHLNDNIFVFRTKEILFSGKVNFRLLSFVATLKILKMEEKKVLLVISLKGISDILMSCLL